ncbi:hypothetical protein [Cytobacillus sp. IB215665]|uniref:hypothetical protein n=1 Tax=Cytobacillus sp. IB215665 TaxID=3097357 RepID=UPI0039B760EA
MPRSFKKVLMECLGNYSLRWFLRDDMEQPCEFMDIFCRTPNWSLEFLSPDPEDDMMLYGIIN